MIELLMVIIIIGTLIALLLPAINGAIKTARKAAVSAEIAQLAQALANFKAKYGDYPPSRFLAIETGDYTSALGSTTIILNTTGSIIPPTATGQVDPYSPGDGDITLAQLAQRSVATIRKFWPRVNTATGLATLSYDFNGNGKLDPPYVLHGHECLVFFLGGVPAQDGSGNLGMIGFDKNPQNPFTNNVAGSALFSANRQPPQFEFNTSRLTLDPNSASQIPGYYDSLGNAAPVAAGTPSQLNFYAYFSAYGNGAYDPNDVNFPESDANGNGPIGLSFSTVFPIFTTKAVTICDSYAPNPYTSTLTVGSPVTFQNPQSFQIISSGLDGLYGVGGQYSTNATTSAVVALPHDSTNTFYGATNGASVKGDTDPTIRSREGDNVTNFKAGSLQ